MTELNQRLGGTQFSTTGDFAGVDADGNVTYEFAVIPYNNLVYLIRAVTTSPRSVSLASSALRAGFSSTRSCQLRSETSRSRKRRGYKRSGLSFFGQSYTPTTMVDSLDNLDFTDIAGEAFYTPTIFVPIPELDASAGIVADISNFSGEQIWTFLYSEVIAELGERVNGVTYANGFNLDVEGKPILSVQKLQFVYDPIAVLFTPNDLDAQVPAASQAAGARGHERADPRRDRLALGGGATRTRSAAQRARSTAAPVRL